MQKHGTFETSITMAYSFFLAYSVRTSEIFCSVLPTVSECRFSKTGFRSSCFFFNFSTAASYSLVLSSIIFLVRPRPGSIAVVKSLSSFSNTLTFSVIMRSSSLNGLNSASSLAYVSMISLIPDREIYRKKRRQLLLKNCPFVQKPKPKRLKGKLNCR